MAVTSNLTEIQRGRSKEITDILSRLCRNTNKTKQPIHLGTKSVHHSHEKISSIIRSLKNRQTKQGIHSYNHLKSAGFDSIDNAGTTRCTACGLEISTWTSDMTPLTIHKTSSPHCQFILSLYSSHTGITTDINETSVTSSSFANSGQPAKKLKIDNHTDFRTSRTFTEISSLQHVRKRTFSHWPRQSLPFVSQLIRAGFFGCNVGDRTICIYCNIICQQWNENIDDPCELHKIISPKCPYIIAMLTTIAESASSSLTIINGQTSTTTDNDALKHTTIVNTAAVNSNYIEIPKRYTSFSNWPTENVPSVDDLVKAGFFFAGKDTIVTCFYCNGSLQNWGANDNPMIEHARWFPHCAYAKQLCGAELYQKIQESKRALQERNRSCTSDNQSNLRDQNMSIGKLFIPDESTLSRLVAARLDLPVSQRLLDSNFKLSVIKRCWEDQLRLKHDDFESDSELWMACTILRKQIEIINGNKNNIVVPSVAMKRIRENKEKKAAIISKSGDSKNGSILQKGSSKSQEVEMEDVSEMKEKVDGIGAEKKPSSQQLEKVSESVPTLANPCILCKKEEKRLACIPCGHLVTCSTCVKSVRSCPVCRLSVEAFVRVFL